MHKSLKPNFTTGARWGTILSLAVAQAVFFVFCFFYYHCYHCCYYHHYYQNHLPRQIHLFPVLCNVWRYFWLLVVCRGEGRVAKEKETLEWVRPGSGCRQSNAPCALLMWPDDCCFHPCLCSPAISHGLINYLAHPNSKTLTGSGHLFCFSVCQNLTQDPSAKISYNTETSLGFCPRISFYCVFKFCRFYFIFIFCVST